MCAVAVASKRTCILSVTSLITASSVFPVPLFISTTNKIRDNVFHLFQYDITHLGKNDLKNVLNELQHFALNHLLNCNLLDPAGGMPCCSNCLQELGIEIGLNTRALLLELAHKRPEGRLNGARVEIVPGCETDNRLSSSGGRKADGGIRNLANDWQ